MSCSTALSLERQALLRSRFVLKDAADTRRGNTQKFQLIKGLPQSGLMTTETLNALGVPAVN